MGTKFKVGQSVRAVVTAQGLRRGSTYEVFEVRVQASAFGGFVTYLLVDEMGGLVSVQNGHLVLTAA